MMSSSLCECFVRSVKSEDQLTISFKYLIDSDERQFNLKRNKDEEVGRVFARITQNINNCIKKKNKKNKVQQTSTNELSPDDVTLRINDEIVENDIVNREAWKEGATLTIASQNYSVILNGPSVKSLKLPKCIMAGFPLYPNCDLEFCSFNTSKFIWYKQRLGHDKVEQQNNDINCKEWIKLGTHLPFVPSLNDIGRKLKVVCIPHDGIRDGLPEECSSLNGIEAGPGECPFEERHCFTKDLTPKGSFRMISYNILADLYADSDYSRTVLYPYCPPYALDIDYRKQLLLKEITGYNGDIYCLQEVDSKFYNSDLRTTMLSLDFEGVFDQKGEKVAEGLACFYRNSKFKLLKSSSITLSDALTNNSILKNLLDVISNNENLLKRFLSRATIWQWVLLECIDQSDKAILCCNTHLYFHPDADHIRMLQGYICAKLIEDKIKKLAKKHPNLTIVPIFCGDFNSCPEFAVYHLMTEGLVPKECEDWKSNSDEVVDGIPLKHNLSFSSACGTPIYTNYVLGFNGCLDYVFYDNRNLEVKEVVPFPIHEKIIEHVALPNIVFPSDHIALVCTLLWK